jgi:hypothetical protein
VVDTEVSVVGLVWVVVVLNTVKLSIVVVSVTRGAVTDVVTILVVVFVTT